MLLCYFNLKKINITFEAHVFIRGNKLGNFLVTIVKKSDNLGGNFMRRVKIIKFSSSSIEEKINDMCIQLEKEGYYILNIMTSTINVNNNPYMTATIYYGWDN